MRISSSRALWDLRRIDRDVNLSDRGGQGIRPVPVDRVRDRPQIPRARWVDGLVGACGDNAAVDSFFVLLQKQVLDRQRWTSRGELRVALVIWIERTYHHHRRRRQRGLRSLTPIEYETLNTAAQAA